MFGACMNVLFIIEVEILVLIKWSYCSTSLIWRVRLHKTMVYYADFVFSIRWRFGHKCCSVEVFQENSLFECEMSFYVHSEDT